jgi:tRNA threonylcarbamoyladenosine biosynthesis protein TsaB
MPNILAIETATEACSAALIISENGNTKVYERFQLAPREHTKLILPMLEEVLAEAGIKLRDVDAIAFGRGPGAFTGLRIAAGIAQGLALSVDKPVIPVSTLQALAIQALDESKFDECNKGNATIISALDARMGEIYWGEFKFVDNHMILIGSERISSPEILEDTLSKENKVIAIGSGWDVYEEILIKKGNLKNNITHLKDNYPNALAVAKTALTLFQSGNRVIPEDAQPVYIRNNVAKKSSK